MSISQLLIIISFVVSKSLQVLGAKLSFSSKFSLQNFMLQPSCLRANSSRGLGISVRFSLLRSQYSVTLQTGRDKRDILQSISTKEFACFLTVNLFCPRNCDALPDFWYAIGDIHITSFLIVVLDFIISFWRLSFFKFELCVTVS